MNIEVDDDARELVAQIERSRRRRHIPFWTSRREDGWLDELTRLARDRGIGLVQGSREAWLEELRSKHPAEPEFRLPPRGWITEYVHEALTELGYGERAHVFGEFNINTDDWKNPPLIDCILREMLPQPPYPFRPLTETRHEDDKLVSELQAREGQVVDLLMADQYRQYRKSIHIWKHDNHATADFIRLLNHPAFLTEFPRGTVLYRQSPCAYPHKRDPYRTTPSQREVHREHVTKMILGLQAGDVVHYASPISSTTHSYNLDSLMYSPPDWNKSDTLTTGDTWEPDGVKFELAPIKGLYYSIRMQELVKSHLDESEVIHPNDTYWRVEGWNDVAFWDDRMAVDQFRRWPTLHMTEIGKQDAVDLAAVSNRGCIVEVDTAPGADYSGPRNW